MKQLFILSLLFTLTLSCTPSQKTQNNNWWKDAIVYQLYPRSFKDTNGDGIGDINGIIEQLDYIKSLGVTAVWLNPIYTSPNADNGYDVSNYREISAEFGTMSDFDRLLKEMHSRDLKLVMDVVVNHSSDQHEWFKQSRSSRDNPYRNYYHWWPAEKGKPNYRYSLFDPKGDAWKYDSTTNAYYLHYFSDKQPDLNWENPKLRKEVKDIMIFWAKKGVDGFRLDAFQFAAKDTTFPKLPNDLEKNFIKYYAMQGNLHNYLKEMNAEVFSKYNVMSVAEGAGSSFEDAHNLVDEDRNELNMAYAFEGVDIAKSTGYSLVHFKQVFSKWDSAFAQKGWLSIFLSNHDQARLVSRFGNDSPAHREASSKMLQTFILSMRGTPYCYYGDELGMTNTKFERIEQFTDIAALNGYQKVKNSGGDVAAYMKDLIFSSRENGRTPMQWNKTTNAGFSSGTPWLAVNKNYETINVEQQDKEANSVLNYFRKMTTLRKQNPVLVHGKYTILQPQHPEIYAYTRTLEGKTMLVVLNFTASKSVIELAETEQIKKTLINNFENVDKQGKRLTLQPYQAVIFELY